MQSTAYAVLPSISLLLASSRQLSHMLLFVSVLARRLGSGYSSEKIVLGSKKMSFPSNIGVHLYQTGVS